MQRTAPIVERDIDIAERRFALQPVRVFPLPLRRLAEGDFDDGDASRQKLCRACERLGNDPHGE